MPSFLVGVLGWFASNLIAKVLIGASLGIFSYYIINDFVNDLIDKIVVQMNGGISSDIVQILSLMGVITALNTILSALTIVGYLLSIQLVFGRK